MPEERTTDGAGAEGAQAGQPAPSQETVAGQGDAQQPDLSKMDLSTLPQWRALEAKLQSQRDEANRRAEQLEAKERAREEAARQAALSATHQQLVQEGLDPQKAQAILAPLEQVAREQGVRYVESKVKADLLEAGLTHADLPKVNGQPWYGRSEAEWTSIVAEAKAIKELKQAREAEEQKLATAKEKAKQAETEDRRASGADRIAGGEPAPAAKGLAAIKQEMQATLKGATGNMAASIRRDARIKARQAGYNPDW